ncbi:MAG: hypothetical protein AAGB05_07020 [Pseudomonadota bacterium]
MVADTLSREKAHLKARLAKVEAALAEVQEANHRLADILRTTQRETSGKRSEKLSPDQVNMPLEWDANDAPMVRVTVANELAKDVLDAAQEKP